MNVSLTPELESYARSKVESGRYNSVSEVVREALRLSQERDARLAHLRGLIQEGMESGSAGEYDPEDIRQGLLSRMEKLQGEVERGARPDPRRDADRTL